MSKRLNLEVGEQIDVSMDYLCLYDLDWVYGKSILKKHVVLCANCNGEIIDKYTYEGILGKLLEDDNTIVEYKGENLSLGDFLSDRTVLLIERGEDKLIIDYEFEIEEEKEVEPKTTINITIDKCSMCPHFCTHYEFGTSGHYCGHPSAPSSINHNAAYTHVGTDFVSSDSISPSCPML